MSTECTVQWMDPECQSNACDQSTGMRRNQVPSSIMERRVVHRAPNLHNATRKGFVIQIVSM